jgi:hypothetical protein
MNRLIRIFAIANAILFTFIIPFTAVYLRQERMYSRNADIAVIYAAEMDEKGGMVLEAASSSREVQLSVLPPQAAPKPSLPKADWVLSHDIISAEAAPEILKVIAQCESGGDPHATSDTSTAKGLLQILDGTWKQFGCTGDVFNPDDSMRCGIKIATISGLHHWDPSRACWSKILAE